MSSEKIFNVVDDNGYYSHKLAHFDSTGAIRTMKYQTVIGTAQEALSSLGGGLADMYETEEGERYVCNAHVRSPLAIRSKDYGTSVENRVLVNHGLVKLDLAGKKVRLATALPMRDYYTSTGQKNVALINAQAENMRKPVYLALDENRQEAPIATIHESRVLSEGVSALIDYLINDDGTEACDFDDLHAPMAVLDFGGSTFDVVAMTPELNILQDSSGTLERGTLDIRERFSELLVTHMNDYGVKMDRPAPWMIEQALSKGYVRTNVKGEMTNIPVKEVLKQAAEPVVKEVKAFTKSKLKELRSYQHILLVGGGALLCRELFDDWADEYGLQIRDEFANARGMLKYITYLNPSH
jgi:plasmid segregation protein ParM